MKKGTVQSVGMQVDRVCQCLNSCCTLTLFDSLGSLDVAHSRGLLGLGGPAAVHWAVFPTDARHSLVNQIRLCIP